LIGRTLGKYRIVEQIGRGGMASVYKAYHPGLDRYVAIKLMHAFLVDEEGFAERFRREAQSVARLRHPNIVQMYDFDVEGDTSYMVMEFLQGPSLKHRLAELEAQGGWLTLEEAAQIVRGVGEALDYAHRNGMVHRDVKPANIMLTDDGGAILTDFGIVKMLSAATQLTASGALIGTPAYMSPEQTTGLVGDERTDIYSLGIVLYQLATGRLPYDADTPMAIVLKHLNAPLPIPTMLNPDIPEGVERVILKSLAKNPDDRYQTVRDMLDHLDSAMRGERVPAVDRAITTASQPITGSPTLTGKQLPAGTTPPRRPTPFWAVGSAALLLVAILVGGFALFGRTSPTPTPTPTTAVALAPPTSSPTITATETPRPTNTPDVAATNSAATVVAAALTVGAPTRTAIPTPTNTPTPTSTHAPTPTPTATATPTPEPTVTPDLTVAALAACNFDAKLEEHVTAPLGAYFAPGAQFRKTWRLSNSGDCPWPAGTVLVFVSGDQFGADDELDVKPVVPGETIEVSLAFDAPRAIGFFSGVWRLKLPDGDPFGEEIPVAVNVGPTPTPRATNTPRPTSTPGPTDTPPASPTSTGPLEMSIPSILPGSCWLDPNTGRWGGTLVWSAWGGGGNYEYFAEGVGPEFQLAGPSHDFSSQVNHRWPGSLYTRSGETVVKVDRWVEPSECGY
jgi:serine/threonine protein kinase